MKKLYVIAPFPEDATSYYRCMGIIDHLEKLMGGTWEIIKHRKEQNLRSWCDLQSADALFVQRPATAELLKIMQYYLQVYQRPIWIDFDDNLFEVPMYNHTRKFYNSDSESFGVMTAALDIADVITVSTLPLKNYLEGNMLKLIGKIVVVPNAFPDVYIDIKRRKPVERTNSVLWRGGNTHSGDLEFYKDEIIELIAGNIKTTFYFAGIDSHYLDGFTFYPNVTLLPGIDPNLYYINLQRFGSKCVMVPLVDNIFNFCKSNVAFIEATWAGMMTVARDFVEWNKPGVKNYEFRMDFQALTQFCIDAFDEDAVNQSWQYICDNLLLSKVNKQRAEILKNLLA